MDAPRADGTTEAGRSQAAGTTTAYEGCSLAGVYATRALAVAAVADHPRPTRLVEVELGALPTEEWGDFDWLDEDGE